MVPALVVIFVLFWLKNRNNNVFFFFRFPFLRSLCVFVYMCVCVMPRLLEQRNPQQRQHQGKEKDNLVQMLKAAAKATQLRASLLNCAELQQVQAFAARLGRSKELQAQTMPPWWKVDVHDAHLLIVSSVYGAKRGPRQHDVGLARIC